MTTRSSISPVGRTPRILVVDDDEEQAEAVADLLSSRLDMETVVETDPTVVADKADANAVDCIVSDYEMPNVDGLSQIRDEHANLPFILLTGAGSERVASQALSQGASEYVQKGTS